MARRILGICLGLIVAAIVLVTSPANAATVTSTILGQYGRHGMGCLQGLTIYVGDGENCMYNGGPAVNTTGVTATKPTPPYPTGYPFGESTGPYGQVRYYDLTQAPCTFDVGYAAKSFEQFDAAPTSPAGCTSPPNMIYQVVAGTFTVDDKGTASPADDTIAFTVTLTSPLGGDVVRQLGSTNTSTEDKYHSMTQALAAYKVDFATPNALGGYDYVIGSAGYPTLITYNSPYAEDDGEPTNANPSGTLGPNRCNGQPFADIDCNPSFTAPFVFDPLRWVPWSTPASGRPGISRMEGNIGARSVGTLTGAACVDSGTSNACKVSKVSFGPYVIGPNNTPAGGTSAEDPGWDDVYLKVVTDAGRKVISVQAITTQEYNVFGTQGFCTVDYQPLMPPAPYLSPTDPGFNCNSWIAERFTASGIVARNDGPITVDLNVAASQAINVLANDQGFSNPVTVTILTQPTKGPAVVVNGSPGNAAGISVTYKANLNASGADSFVYQVADGLHTDTARVSINIIPLTAAPGARDDNAVLNVPAPSVDVFVAANDVLSGATATVAVDPNSFRVTNYNRPQVGVHYAGLKNNVPFQAGDVVKGQTSQATATVQVVTADPPQGSNPSTSGSLFFTQAIPIDDPQVKIFQNGEELVVTGGADATVSGVDSGDENPIRNAAKHGTVVVNGSGGPTAGIFLTYTPSASNTPGQGGSSPYTEWFDYTIDDGNAVYTGTVFVYINYTPLAADAPLPMSTQGNDPIGLAPDGITPAPLDATFTPPGPGGSLGNQGATSSVTITSDGTRGTAQVSSDGKIKYTITDPTFYFGTDAFTYQITDLDGQTASATVTVTIPNVAPTMNLPPIATDQDHYSTKLGISRVVTFGNGGRDTGHQFAIEMQALHGTCDLTPLDSSGGLVYTPNPGYSGPDSCTLTITDHDGQLASSTTQITVNPVMTVTPNVGGAGMDPGTLAFLGGLPLLRRWRRRSRPAVRASLARRGASGVASRGAGRLAMLAALCGLSVAAFGQTGPSAADSKPAAESKPVVDSKEQKEKEAKMAAVGEMVVTARKVEENLKEVPLSITAFDADTIEQAGIKSLNDVADMTPGLSFFNALGENLPVPVIRGVVPTDIFGSNNAAVFVDGVYVAGRSGLNFDLLDTERIEVVKGPQSALYGRNAFSGAINYVSKKPSADFEGKGVGEFGSAGKRKVAAMVSGPLFADTLGDTLRGRLAAQYEDYSGTYSNALAGGGDVGGHLFRSYQASLFWQPVQPLEVNLGYYKSVDRIDESSVVSLPANCEDVVEPPVGIFHIDGKPDIVPTPGLRFQNYCGEVPGIKSIPGLNGGQLIPKVYQATGEKRDLDRVHLRVDWDLAEWGTLSSLSGFSYTHQSSAGDFGRSLGYNQPFLYCQPASIDVPGNPNNCLDTNNQLSPANKTFFAGTYDIELGSKTSEFSEELRYTSPKNLRLRGTGGLYWYKSDVKSYPGAPVIGFANQQPPYSQNIAPFNQAQLGFGLPPFDASAPDFAIGTAIFYTSLATDGLGRFDGGIDPLGRITGKEETDGWAVFSGLDFDIIPTLTAHLEGRMNWEAQHNTSYGYASCINKTIQEQQQNCLDDVYDLRYVDPIPLGTLPTTNGGTTPGCANPVNGLAQGTRCTATLNPRFNLATGRVGLDWKFVDGWMAYTSVAYGQKPGGSRLIRATAVCPSSDFPGCQPDNTLPTLSRNYFAPESIIAYELGAKGVFGERLGLDVAVFYNDWKDIVLRQLRDTDPDSGLSFTQPVGFNVNAGSAHVLGMESTAQLAITDNLTGNLTFGWTQAKLVDAKQDTYSRFATYRDPAKIQAACGPQPAATPPPNPPPADPTTIVDPLRNWWLCSLQASGDVSGNTLLRQPEYKASASLSYKHPLYDDWNWFARGDASYQSSVYVGNENEGWLPAHTYVNGKVGMSNAKYAVNFWVRNLFNDGGAIAAFRDIYWANTSNLYPPYTDQGPRPNFSQFVPYRYSVTYPQERTIGLNVEVRFGGAVK